MAAWSVGERARYRAKALFRLFILAKVNFSRISLRFTEHAVAPALLGAREFVSRPFAKLKTDPTGRT